MRALCGVGGVLILVVQSIMTAPNTTTRGSAVVTAFDCNQTTLDTVTYDLTRVAECPDISSRDISETTRLVQVIQQKEYGVLRVYRCHVTVTPQIWHCGMHSHTSIVSAPFSAQPLDVSEQECRLMQMDGVYKTATGAIVRLKRNTTSLHTVDVAGKVHPDGTCVGGSSHINGQPYYSVVHREAIQIRLEDKLVHYKIGDTIVVGFGGVTCRLADISCHDFDVGRMYWTLDAAGCLDGKYDVLYTGDAAIIHTAHLGPNKEYMRVLRRASTPFQIFTPLLGDDSACGVEVRTTPYAGLYVALYQSSPPFPIGPITYSNVDVVKYLEAKMVTFAYGSALTAREMVVNLERQQCSLHRETLLNRLHIVASTPSSATLLLDNEPGVFGRVAGEVVHLLRCPAVEVTLRRADHCSLEIPIRHLGRDVYMEPRTRIITTEYTHRECGPLVPVMFRHGNQWVQFSPQYSPAPEPKKIHPMSPTLPSFERLVAYARGGIYDPRDLQQLRDFILFSHKRDAIETNIVAGLSGQSAPKYDLTQVLNSGGWEELARDRLQQIWGKFQGLGKIVNGLVGIYVCFVIVRITFGLILRTFTIYNTHGCTKLMLGVWSSALTHFLLSLAGRERQEPREESAGRYAPVDQPRPPPEATEFPSSGQGSIYPPIGL
ncbi:glycoprotein [Tacheng Tick Virus 4]|uniref:Glycoprotein n=1 Tax=Tacheng Tick Virus 4 TaxID=1608086 RepID=A0A0B5KJV8_9VIRU|nr:glycoprotein [Tacheng Tick Virus 4]AJG39055.1 glycoprotein [Tacheng Tick Virus 4]